MRSVPLHVVLVAWIVASIVRAQSANVCPPVVALAAGEAASYALRADGSVWSWGKGGFVAGNGASNQSPSPIPVRALVPVAAVAIGAGYDNAIALGVDGNVYIWGDNLNGRLGLPPVQVGNQYYVTLPTLVPGLAGVASIAVGPNHRFARTTAGVWFGWGENGSGELGLGYSGGIVSTPTPIPSFAGLPSVFCGSSRTFALTAAGSVLAVGNNSNGALGLGSVGGSVALVTTVPNISSVIDVACTNSSTHACRADGTVFGWGANDAGQLGFGMAGQPISLPVQAVNISGVVDVSAVINGGVIARRADGTLWGWGRNTYGELGIGQSALGSFVPVPVQLLTPLPLSSVTALYNFCLALSASGGVYTWGPNFSQQTANSTTSGDRPTRPDVLTNALGPCGVISSVSIDHCAVAGQTPITIHGSDFLPTSVASVATVPLQNQVVVDPQTITGLTPPFAAPTAADVVIATPAGTSTLVGAMTVDHAVLALEGTASLGATFTLRFASYSSKPVVLLGDTAPGPVQLGSFGFAGIGFSSALVPLLDYVGAFTHTPDPNAVLDPSGQWSAPATVPNIPGLVGITLYAQGFVLSFNPLPPNALFYPTNTLAVTIVP